MSKKQPKKRYTFRFSVETIKKIDRGVQVLKEKLKVPLDRTKFLERLINVFAAKGK